MNKTEGRMGTSARRKSQRMDLQDFEGALKRAFVDKYQKVKKLHHRLSYDETIDKCTEMFRSVCLFLTISKFLGFLALILLFVASDDLALAMLRVDEGMAHTVYELPKSVTITKVLLFVQQVLVAVLGIAAFALLNRKLLFFYGTTTLILAGIMLLPILHAVDKSDKYREKLFLQLKNHGERNRSVHLLQSTIKCCGSEVYNYEDRIDRPTSCCDNLTDDGRCTEELAFKTLCQTNTTSFLVSMQKRGALVQIAAAYFGYCGFMVVEAILTIYMFLRVSKIQMKNSLMDIHGL